MGASFEMLISNNGERKMDIALFSPLGLSVKSLRKNGYDVDIVADDAEFDDIEMKSLGDKTIEFMQHYVRAYSQYLDKIIISHAEDDSLISTSIKVSYVSINEDKRNIYLSDFFACRIGDVKDIIIDLKKDVDFVVSADSLLVISSSPKTKTKIMFCFR